MSRKRRWGSLVAAGLAVVLVSCIFPCPDGAMAGEGPTGPRRHREFEAALQARQEVGAAEEKPDEAEEPMTEAELEELRDALRRVAAHMGLDGGDPGVQDMGDDVRGEWVGHLCSHPLVSGVLTLARRSGQARAEAVRFIVDDYRRYFTELPLWQEPDEPRYRPSVLGPGGMAVYPFILGRLEAVETLPLLVEVIRKDQGALHGYRASRGAPLPDEQYVGSFHGLMLAYGCDRFLQEYGEREELLEKCTVRQRTILEEYAAFRADVIERTAESARALAEVYRDVGVPVRPLQALPDMLFFQTRIMKTAGAFVEAGAQDERQCPWLFDG